MLVVVCRSHSRVAAHQLAVLGEGHVALHDARAHARAGLVGLLGVLGELQRGAAMADGEVGAVERAVLALLQLVLERAFVHAVDQIERPRAELDGVVGPAGGRRRIGEGHGAEAGEHGKRGCERDRVQDVAHEFLLESLETGVPEYGQKGRARPSTLRRVH